MISLSLTFVQKSLKVKRIFSWATLSRIMACEVSLHHIFVIQSFLLKIFFYAKTIADDRFCKCLRWRILCEIMIFAKSHSIFVNIVCIIWAQSTAFLTVFFVKYRCLIDWIAQPSYTHALKVFIFFLRDYGTPSGINICTFLAGRPFAFSKFGTIGCIFLLFGFHAMVC